jgi:hypothetical protein
LIPAEQVACGIEDRQRSPPLPGSKGKPLLPEIAFSFLPSPRLNGQVALEQERKAVKDVGGRQAFAPDSAIVQPGQEFDWIG